MKKSFPVLYILLTLVAAPLFGQVLESNLRRHIRILANDSLEGRGTGSKGGDMAAAYLGKEFRRLGLTPMGDKNSYFQPFPFMSGVHGTGKAGTAKNVIGFIDNHAPLTIVVGAHYDHLGMGNDGNSLDANPKNKVHNGADDNASGVAGVLELARDLSTNGKAEKNNFLIVCFSGEELGLLGSKYLTEHLPMDSTKFNFMINLDMIGRLNPATNVVDVSGTGTSPVWETALRETPAGSLVIKTDSSGMGPSDHSSFYLKHIPALHFFTGSHSDYHKPSDDFEKINYAGEVLVLDYILRLIDRLDTIPRLAFLPTKNKSMGSSRSFKVTLGIMPSYSAQVEGLQVDGVSEGKPAQAAGIRTGDIIIKMGDLTIKDIQGYMEALGKFEKGQTVPVSVRRAGEVITIPVTF